MDVFKSTVGSPVIKDEATLLELYETQDKLINGYAKKLGYQYECIPDFKNLSLSVRIYKED